MLMLKKHHYIHIAAMSVTQALPACSRLTFHLFCRCFYPKATYKWRLYKSTSEDQGSEVHNNSSSVVRVDHSRMRYNWLLAHAFGKKWCSVVNYKTKHKDEVISQLSILLLVGS